MNVCQDREVAINLHAAKSLSKEEETTLMEHLSTCHGCRSYHQEQSALCEELFHVKSASTVKWSTERRLSFKKAIESSEGKKDCRFQEASLVPVFIKAAACLLVTTCFFGYFHSHSSKTEPNYRVHITTKSNLLFTQSNNLMNNTGLDHLTLNEEDHLQMPWPLLTPQKVTSI